MIHCNGVKGWLPDIRHQNINRSSTMTTQNGKRKLPRRELPWIGTLLDNLSFSKLPTNGDVLRRLMFELERHSGTCSSTELHIASHRTSNSRDFSGCQESAETGHCE